MRQNVIMIMSLSGTMVVLLYFLIYPLLNKYTDALWRYRFLRMALLFFLVPFPELKYHFFTILQSVFGFQNIQMEESVPQILNRARSIIVEPSGQLIFPEMVKNIFIIALVIASCSLVIISMQFYQYFVVKYRIMHYGSEAEPSQNVVKLLETLSKELKLKKETRVLLSSYVTEPMVLGVITPVLLLPIEVLEWEKKRLYYILKHELIHIKSNDLVFKFLGWIVMAVHWFNPCCILLFKELSEVAEICCDKQVLAGRSEDDRREYGALLIDMAVGKGKYTGHHILLSSKLIGTNTKKMKRRLQEMQKKERVNKLIGSFVMIIVFQMVFVTAVFAYDPIRKLEVGCVDVNACEVREIFIPGTVQQEVIDDSTMGGSVFLEDETGLVYNVDERKPRVYCDHTYSSGTKQEHIKYSGGNCRVDYYEAQRCLKCGDTKVGDKYNSLHYDVCPH